LALDLCDDTVAAATARGVNAIQADYLQYELPAASFDCVVFARSLHHIEPLPTAVHKTFELLCPGGLLLLDDFAAELIDERSLAWLRHTDAAIPAPLRNPNPHGHRFPADSVELWHEHHFGKHHVLKGSDLRQVITRTFGDVEFEPAPYLYRYLVDRLVETPAAAQVLSNALAAEQAAIKDGSITAIGLRAVAAR
jgi:SAM-dependent methyltransferase